MGLSGKVIWGLWTKNRSGGPPRFERDSSIDCLYALRRISQTNIAAGTCLANLLVSRVRSVDLARNKDAGAVYTSLLYGLECLWLCSVYCQKIRISQLPTTIKQARASLLTVGSVEVIDPSSQCSYDGDSEIIASVQGIAS